MNVDIWVVYGFAGILVVLLGVQMFLRFRINDLEARNVILNDKINDMRTKYEYLDDRTTELEMDIERLKGRIENNYTTVTARLSEIDKKQACNKDSFIVLSNAIGRLVEVVDNLYDGESTDVAESDSRAVSEAPGGIPEGHEETIDIQGDTDGDKACLYQEYGDALSAVASSSNRRMANYSWIFPSSDADYSTIRFCDEYLVIGRIKKSTNKPSLGVLNWSPVDSKNAYWNGSEFITDDDEVFDKVYAFIRIPKPTDVMEQIISSIAEEKSDRGDEN